MLTLSEVNDSSTVTVYGTYAYTMLLILLCKGGIGPLFISNTGKWTLQCAIRKWDSTNERWECVIHITVLRIVSFHHFELNISPMLCYWILKLIKESIV